MVIYRLSRKNMTFAHDSKYRHIIYRWKSFSTTSMDSRSLPENKATFGFDLFTKFCYFAWKSVPMIWALSSQMKSTITTRRSRRICWYPAPSWKMAGDHHSTDVEKLRPHAPTPHSTSAIGQCLSSTLVDRPPLDVLVWRMRLGIDRRLEIAATPKREREKEREEEIRGKREEKRVWEGAREGEVGLGWSAIVRAPLPMNMVDIWEGLSWVRETRVRGLSLSHCLIRPCWPNHSCPFFF